MKSARCPGRTLRIVGTHPVEARSFVKITLRSAGCGRPVSVAIEWSASPERAGFIRVDRIPIDFHRSRESTTPRHLVFACESRLPEEVQSLNNDDVSACELIVGIPDYLWMRLDISGDSHAIAHSLVQKTKGAISRALQSSISHSSIVNASS